MNNFFRLEVVNYETGVTVFDKMVPNIILVQSFRQWLGEGLPYAIKITTNTGLEITSEHLINLIGRQVAINASAHVQSDVDA